MAMTREEFDALVGRIEERFADRPLALRLRVAMIVALGYAGFLFGLFLAVVAAALLWVGAMVVDPGVGIFLLILGSFLLTVGVFQAIEMLWARLQPQPGWELTAKEAPQLFEILARVRRELRAAKPNRVLLTPELNASILQIPRLGVFGWSHNWLYLGLPLMETLSPAEFESVLAHEHAHLSAQHGRFAAWVYRLRRTWQRVFERLHEPPKSKWEYRFRLLVVKFVDWYWPRFNAWAFVLSRTNEYAADRCAGEWAGVEPTASALWRLACFSQHLEEFWESLWLLAKTEPQPPGDLMHRLMSTLLASPPPADACRWTQRAACRLTDNLDTHPSVSDRLRALGRAIDRYQVAGFPAPARPSAAEVLFGRQLETFRQEVNALWQREANERWRSRYGRAATLQRKLATMAEVARDPQSDPDLLWDKAGTVLDLEGPAAAEPLLRHLLELKPDHSAANLVLGQHLLDQGKPEGEELLRRILEAEEDELTPQACQVLARHFQSAGLRDRVQEVHRRLSRHQAAVAAGHRERNTVTVSDHFLPHDLFPEELAALREVLAGQADLASAWLVRKELKHFPGQRLFVLCVRAVGSSWAWRRASRDQQLVTRLMPLVRLPGRVLIIAPQAHFRRLSRKVMAMPGARVHPPA